MSKQYKVWIHKEEVKSQILKTPELASLLEEKANEIASNTGDDYSVEVKTGKNRMFATVKSSKGGKDNKLLKSMRGAKQT